MALHEKRELHRRFWSGDGPSLILIPPEEQELYDTTGYPERFEDPEAMWRFECGRAESVIGWPTDGIPTVRPNLGVVFIPSMAGLPVELRDGSMPWLSGRLGREDIRALSEVDIGQTLLMRRAESFYRLHSKKGNPEIAAYHADTQGIFDLAHLLYGDELFLDLADPEQEVWIEELLQVCGGLFESVSQWLKDTLAEKPNEMIHGHGTSQGVYFPRTGIRISEDSATLISPDMIRRHIIPAIEKASSPFGGAFVHFCGKHDGFLDMLCRSECVHAVDLGNPEYYDTRDLLELCSATNTVLYSRLPALPGETWPVYIERIGGLVRDTGARCILRPLVYPAAREECADMLMMWHDIT